MGAALLIWLLLPITSTPSLALFIFAVLFSARYGGMKPSLIPLAVCVYLAITTSLQFPEPIIELIKRIPITAGLFFIAAVFAKNRDLSAGVERLVAMVESSNDAIVTKDLSGVITSWNQGAEDMYGYSSKEAVGKRITILIPDDRLFEEEDIISSIKRGRVVEHYETIRKRKDGSVLDVSITISPIKNARGEIVGASNIARNITSRKEVERQLIASEEKFKAQFMGTPVPIFSWKRYENDFILTDYNHAAVVLTHDKIHELSERRASEVYENNPEVWELMNRAFDGKTTIRKEGWFTLITTKEPRYLDTSFVYVAPDFVMTHTEDLTERKYAEDELVRAKEEAENANRAKDQFLAVLSHELKTPLSSILGYATLLSSGKLGDKPEQTTVALKTIERNARAQVELIEDLLDVSRIISGKITLKKLIVGIPGLVQQACDSFTPLATDKHITLNCIEPTDKFFVTGDPQRLQQVLMNIISNAIKFTPEGGRVYVTTVRRGTKVDIIIKDTGIGISKEFMPLLFQRFRQAQPGVKRKFGGLGLGLSIAKSLVDLHDGSIKAFSEGEGKGATFTVTLPLSSPPLEEPVVKRTETEHPLDPAALKECRILLVDDDPDTLEMLRMAVERYSATVITADSAQLARTKLEQFDASIIVSDVGMPIESGYDFMRELRSRGITTPSLALTAFTGEEYAKEAEENGFNSYMSKPVDLEDLIERISIVCSLKKA